MVLPAQVVTRADTGVIVITPHRFTRRGRWGPRRRTTLRRQTAHRRGSALVRIGSVPAVSEQLALDFTASTSQRHRRAVRLAEMDEQPSLFAAFTPNIDIHLHSPAEAIAQLSGREPERAQLWLSGLVGSLRPLKARRVAFATDKLDRLLHIRPPSQVTLDAAATAIGRAIWADKLGLKPLRVHRERQRLLADSPRWPAGLRVQDAPWTAIAALTHLGLPLDVDPAAQALYARKLEEAGTQVAVAGLAGSAVLIKTSRPAVIEGLGLPGLAYAGDRSSGQYKIPLLAAAPLLTQTVVEIPPELRRAIQAATGPIRPLRARDLGAAFPWTLYDFQAEDAARAVRILETTGGVLLAADMGGGKTTIALAVAQYLDIWPLLIVSPLAAFSTWARQLGEMNRSYLLATGSAKTVWSDIEIGTHDAVILSYDRLPAFSELVEHMGFRGLVADEIQRIRTPGSRRSRALRALASSVPLRLGLSGTPLTNTIADLLPIGAVLAPGEWRPRANTKELDDLYPGDPTEAIADHLGSLMVRRRIDQVGRPMPARNDHRIHVELTAEQRAALTALEAEAQAAKESGEFDGPNGKFNALVKLTKMRGILANPRAAGVGGPNPKVDAALRLILDFRAQGRKGVVFTVDRASFTDLGHAMTRAGVRWGGIWGSTPPLERIAVEQRLHAGKLDVVLCTIAAGAEAWTASPTATYAAFLSYVWAPASLAQAEARVYRLNSDLNGPTIEIVYLHATMPGGSLDDRMVEVLEIKKHLFAQVVDRTAHVDTTAVHLQLSDLLYVLTGQTDVDLVAREQDAAAVTGRETARKRHAQQTLYAKKGRNKNRTDLVRDDGSATHTLEQHRTADTPTGTPTGVAAPRPRPPRDALAAARSANVEHLLADVDFDEDGEAALTGAHFDDQEVGEGLDDDGGNADGMDDE
jgi:hypothetical protein